LQVLRSPGHSPGDLVPALLGNLGRAGYTLVEVIVVLILLALAASAVALSLPSFRPEQSSALRALVGSAREASVRRGEMVRLRIDRSGAWQIVAGTPPGSEVRMSGRLADPPSNATDLIFSPLGTCAPPVEDNPVETFGDYDPLTCEARRS